MSSAVRRFAQWYFGEPGRRLVVWGVWAALTLTAAGFVWTYAPDMPVNDEWVFVPQLFADADTQWGWVFERHAEHRYPLARVLYLGLFHASGHDFRPGMWVTVLFLSASAALFVRTAGHLRGKTEYADCWYPILFLHRGHFENLLMGYQIAFTLTVFCVALFAVLVTRREWSANRVGWAGAGLLVPISLGGGIGLLFAPFVGGWLTWRLTLGRRGWFGVGGWVGLLTVVLAAGYTLWGVSDTLASPQPKPPKSLEMVWTAVQTTGITFGPALTSRHSAAGVGLLIAGVLVLPWLGREAWRDPSRRGMLLGHLAVVGGVAVCVAAVALSRENVVSSRYACLVALAPSVVGLSLTGRMPRGIGWTVFWTLFVIAGGGAVVWQNWRLATPFGQLYRAAADAVRADAEAGMPIDLIAETHRYYHIGDFNEYWLTLWQNGVGPVTGAAPPDPELINVSAGIPQQVPAFDARLFRLLPDGEQSAVAIRLRYESAEPRIALPILFDVTVIGADGTERGWTTSIAPWPRAGAGSAVVWVNGRVKAAWVEVGKAEPLTLTGVELLTRQP